MDASGIDCKHVQVSQNAKMSFMYCAIVEAYMYLEALSWHSMYSNLLLLVLSIDGTGCIPLYCILYTAGHSTKYTCTPNVGKPYLPTNGKQTLEHIINIETVW